MDVVVELAEMDRLVRALAPVRLAVAEDHLPTRMMLRSPDSRQVDVHPVTFDVAGTGGGRGRCPTVATSPTRPTASRRVRSAAGRSVA